MSSEPVLSQTVHGIFIGREAELRQLRTLFDNAASGEGSLAMVVGEPGIGKTTLCEQLAEYVQQQGGITLVGHCYEEGSLSLPYLAFVEAMRDYVATRDVDLLSNELGPDAGDVARILPEIRRRMEVEPGPPGDPEQDRYRLLQAVATFLRNASEAQPLLVVLEDLHDADKGTLDMLTYFSRNLGGSRLLIAGTYRDVEVDRAHPLSGTLAELRRASSFERIGLRGLNPDEVQRMMSGVAGREIPWSVAEAVHRQTEGNPLFVQEVVRYLVQERLLVAEQEGSTGGAPIAMSIPEGLRDVIGKRLSGLSPESNRVLGVASVIGREFRVDVLQRVADVSEEELFAALEEATGGAVVEESSSVGPGIAYRFTHAFFRQTLYEEMIAPRRLRLHQRVGRALEEAYGSRLAEHAAEMAEHFGQSTEAEDLTKAIEYGEMAAERAMSVFAYGEAVRLLEQALEVQEVLDPDDRAKRCDLLLALGEAAMRAGDPLRAAEALVPEAFDLAETLGDNSRASAACMLGIWGLGRYGAGMMFETPEWRMWAERADRFASTKTSERVFADTALSWLKLGGQEQGESQALATRALELARQVDDPEAMWFAAIAHLFGGSWAPRHLEGRIRLAHEVADWPREGAAIISLAWSLVLCAQLFFVEGDRDGAEALLGEVEQIAERTRDSPPRLLSLSRANWLLFVDGRLEESLQGTERFNDEAQELGSPVFGRMTGALASLRPLLYLGRAEEASASTGELFDPGSAIRALCLAQLGRRDEAQEILNKLLHGIEIEPKEDQTALPQLSLMLELAVWLADPDAVATLAPRLEGLDKYAPIPGGSSDGRNLGGAAALLGDHEGARAHYQTALEVLTRSAIAQR